MEALLHGFAVTLSLDNLLYCFVGVFLGTVVGILPGPGRVSPCCAAAVTPPPWAGPPPHAPRPGLLRAGDRALR